MYPSPTIQGVTAVGSVYELDNIAVFDALSRDVTKQATVSYLEGRNKAFINLSRLSSGAYILKTSTQSTLIIKQ